MPSRWPFLVYFARLVILLSSSAVLLRLFYVGFDHPCGEMTRRSGCKLLFSHANLIAFSTSFTNAFANPVAQNESNCYFAIAENCIGLSHASCILYSSRYIRVSIYTSPYPHRAKTRPCSKMTDRPSNQPHLRILSPLDKFISSNPVHE